MGLFSGRRKAEQEAAEQRQREEEAERLRAASESEEETKRKRRANMEKVYAWFEALDQHKPQGGGVLTDEILEAVGPFPRPDIQADPQADGHQIRMRQLGDWAGMKAGGRVAARDYEAAAVSERREDAAYWTSVREYCEGILG